MMKRPKAIYLVALWCFLALSVFTGPLLGLNKGYNQQGLSHPIWLVGTSGGVFVFMCYEIWGLLTLRNTQRWICVGLMALWTFVITACMFTVHRMKVVPAIFFSAINLTVIWYLSRPVFGKICRDFEQARISAYLIKKKY